MFGCCLNIFQCIKERSGYSHNSCLLSEETLIASVKGIAEASAIQLLGELLTIPNDLTVKQWVAFVGLNPRHFE